jgi:diguanylate cyclase (GGDEF)-like protein/PAS domain S-box-containing protein
LAIGAVLVDESPDALLALSMDGCVLTWNRGAEAIFGWSAREAVGRPLEDLVIPEERRAEERKALAEVAERGSTTVDTIRRRKDGSLIHVDVSMRRVNAPGVEPFVAVTKRDVTQRRRLREEAALDARFRQLLDAAPDAMVIVGPDGRIHLVNSQVEKIFGYAREELIGQPVEMLVPPRYRAQHPRHRTGYFSDPRARPMGAGLDLHGLRKDGTEFPAEISLAPMQSEAGVLVTAAIRDVTERKRAEEELWHAAFYDGLTGLPNRALFLERLGQALARSKGRGAGGFAVLFLDLDRFKVVNDSMGHRAGDQLLVAIARRLDRIRRAGDTVARMGGDEFALLVEGVGDDAEAGRVADRVHRELSHPFEVSGQEVFTSAAIGIALGGLADHRPEDLLRDADTAMYRAKAQGIARHAVFDCTMHERAVAVLQLENDLRRAIDREELRVELQPIVSLPHQRVAGFEALARWQHPTRGMVPPDEFIPMAEETGIIGPLGRWVLLEACRQVQALHTLHPRGQPPSLSVNLSGRQILQPDLVEEVAEILESTGFDPRLLRLELTESVLVENEAAAARCLQGLRQLGLKLAIDDFGTGYSSLSYLHRMPIDTIKIDASFIRTMAADEKNRRIVETILLLGKNLGVEVIAEGVETQAQALALHRLGCSLVQGHLFSPSVDARAAAALLVREESLPRLHLVS